MFGTVVHADEERVIDDVVVSEELGVHAQCLHQTLLVGVTHLETVLLVDEVTVFKGDGPIDFDPSFVLDCLPTVRGAFQIVSMVDLLSGLEYVVHHTEVDLLLHLASFAEKDYLVKAKDSADH